MAGLQYVRIADANHTQLTFLCSPDSIAQRQVQTGRSVGGSDVGHRLSLWEQAIVCGTHITLAGSKRSRNPLNALHIATHIQVRPLVFGEPASNIGMYPSTLGRLSI
jgi:hypothetical protein